jgi:hypothetical protein
METPTGTWRAATSGLPGARFDHPPDFSCQPDRSGTVSRGYVLANVLTSASSRITGLRFCSSRHGLAAPPVGAVHRGDAHPQGAHPRGYAQSNRTLGRTGRSEPDRGACRPKSARSVLIRAGDTKDGRCPLSPGPTRATSRCSTGNFQLRCLIPLKLLIQSRRTRTSEPLQSLRCETGAINYGHARKPLPSSDDVACRNRHCREIQTSSASDASYPYSYVP